MKLIILFTILIFFGWYRTLPMQEKFIDINMLDIPEQCLDESGDGIFDKNDFNYGGINIADGSAMIVLDSKGAALKKIDCDALITNPYSKLMTADCNNICKIRGYIESP